MRRLLELLVFMVLLMPYSTALSEPLRIRVIASIIPLGYLCERIGGQRVSVQVLIPPGASPHTFEPRPSVVSEVTKARLLVYVGEGLEPWAHRLVKSKGEGALVVEAAKGLPLIQDVQGEKGTSGKSGRSHSHSDGGANPHVWLDPIMMQEISMRIHEAMVSSDPPGRAYYDENLSRLLRDLEDLHGEIQEKVARFKIKEYVCFHSAFTYFSRRYGLREVGVIEVAPGREPSPRHLHRIIEVIRSYGIKAVFAEPQLSPRVAEVIAKEAGVKISFLDPLGGRAPYGNDYLALMRYNLKVMEEVMMGE